MADLEVLMQFVGGMLQEPVVGGAPGITRCAVMAISVVPMAQTCRSWTRRHAGQRVEQRPHRPQVHMPGTPSKTRSAIA